jgi:hypothetical protein
VAIPGGSNPAFGKREDEGPKRSATKEGHGHHELPSRISGDRTRAITLHPKISQIVARSHGRMRPPSRRAMVPRHGSLPDEGVSDARDGVLVLPRDRLL